MIVSIISLLIISSETFFILTKDKISFKLTLSILVEENLVFF